MVAEARLARQLRLADASTVERQERLLTAVGLPTRAEGIDVDGVLTAMRRDKKSRDGRVPFVLAPTIGAFKVVYDVPPADVRAALASLARWLVDKRNERPVQLFCDDGGLSRDHR